MSVTITPTANTALDTDLILSGTVAISGALADNSETLNVSVYYNNNGATYIGIPQVYDGTSTVTYNYANGTVLTVNYSTGAWTFQRLSTELSSTEYEYVITFDFKDSSTVSGSVTVKPTKNITVNDFSVVDLDDLDTYASGDCDITITDITGLTVAVNVSIDANTLNATAQPVTSDTGTYTFNYSDGSIFTLNLSSKQWTYKRKTSDVGDGTSNSYSFNLLLGNVNATISVISVVGSPPSISKFSANKTYDTDSKVYGLFSADNFISGSIKIDVTHNNVLMQGTTETYTENSTITWTYGDSTTFALNTANGEWEYTRVASDKEDLREDSYVFALTITTRYGSDTVSETIATEIPKATILSFTAEGIADTEPNINGVLSYTLPTVANSPTMRVNVIADGVEYIGIPIDLTNVTEFDFTYSDGSKFLVDATEGTFVYQRATDDTKIPASDSYEFECTIIVNGQITSQSLTVNTYSSVRNYDYQPAYPVLFYAGSPEAENTAWAKYIEEIKRVYRLYNENMNYYESLTKGVFKRIDDLEKLVESITNGLAANRKGVILPYVGDLDKIPDGWHLCDGTNGTPNLTNYFLQGSQTAGKYIAAGLPNISGYFYGVFSTLSGAFYTDHSYYLPQGGSSSNPHWREGPAYFSARHTSSIYGNSNTVQPPAYTVYFIMKVADDE